MAAPLRSFLSGTLSSLLARGHHHVTSVTSAPRRFMLSGAYSCSETWKSHLEDPAFSKVSMSDFAFQVRGELERTNRASAVDLNVLAHLFSQIVEDEEVEYMEDILQRFAQCNSSIPRSDSTTHAVLRNFIDRGYASRVPTLVSNLDQFSMFPNYYTLNFILNYFIKQEQFAEASQIAFFSMLQEDFSNTINSYLSLHTCVQRLLRSSLEDLAPIPPEASDGEEDWIRVNYVTFPYYDDHFDIKDERFLLGKTLVMLCKASSIEVPADIRNTLNVTGLGLYHKFQKGISALQEISDSPDGKILQQGLDYFSECLDKVEARDKNEPEVELALRRIEYEIRLLLPTLEEKAELVSELGKLKEQLATQGRVVSDVDLGQSVQKLASQGVKLLEADEIFQQNALFDTWASDRQTELIKQVELYRRNERLEEMKKQVKELQDQEEVLTFFDFEESIRLKFLNKDHAETDRELVLTKD